MKSNLSLLRKLLIAMVIGGAAWYLGVHTTQPNHGDGVHSGL